MHTVNEHGSHTYGCIKVMILLTLSWSLLSARLATINTTKYKSNSAIMVDSTAMFPSSSSWLNSRNTLSKSIGFGSTRNDPPNAVRWLQRQRIFSSVVSSLALKKKSKKCHLYKKYKMYFTGEVYSSNLNSGFHHMVKWIPSIWHPFSIN